MKRLNSFGKKVLTGFLCTVFVVTVFYVPIAPQQSAPRVEAGGLPVIDLFNWAVNHLTTVNTGVTAANSTSSLVIDKILKPLAWALAQAAIHSMTQSIVNWINSGFHGSPAFATDLGKNLRSVSDAAADMFLTQLKVQGGIDLRTPFQDQVAQAVRDSYYKQGRMQSSYNLNQLSSDPQGFINGQFGKGGFNAWFATVLNSDNNPIGALYAAKNGLNSAVEDVRTNQLHELDWGHGFLSWRGSCAASASAGDTGAGAGKACKTNDDCVGTLACLPNGGPGTCAVDKSLDTPVSLSSTDTCLGYNIETPGSIIENQLGITATSPLRQLELAQSINQIVAALAGQLVSHIMGGGGLAGASSPSSGGGGSAVYQGTVSSDSAANSASLADGFMQTLADQRTQVAAYQSNWQIIRGAATAAQTACSGTAQGNATSVSDSSVSVSARIQQIIDTGTIALANAATSLSRLDALKAKATIAADPSAPDQGTAIASVTQDYQNLTASMIYPSTTQMSSASTESQDTGTATPPSQYTALKDLANSNCSAGGL